MVIIIHPIIKRSGGSHHRQCSSQHLSERLDSMKPATMGIHSSFLLVSCMPMAHAWTMAATNCSRSSVPLSRSCLLMHLCSSLWCSCSIRCQLVVFGSHEVNTPVKVSFRRYSLSSIPPIKLFSYMHIHASNSTRRTCNLKHRRITFSEHIAVEGA